MAFLNIAAFIYRHSVMCAAQCLKIESFIVLFFVSSLILSKKKKELN